MAFDPFLEPDEQVSFHFHYVNYFGGKGNPQFGLVLTNRAAYWPGFKFGLIDSIITKRMPLAEVISVSIRDVWHLGRLLVGGVMLTSGVIGIFLISRGIVTARVGQNGAAVVLLVSVLLSGLGSVIAIHGGRRRTLVIASEQTKFRWAEYHVLFGDGPGCSLFEQVCAWAQSNGLHLEVELRE